MLLIFRFFVLRFHSLLLGKLMIRFDVWKETLSLIIKNPHNYGVGTFEYISKNIMDTGIQYNNPYSLYIGITYSLGVLGLVALIFFIKNSLSKKDAGGLLTACSIFAIVGIGYSFLDYTRLAGTAIVLFALLGIA